MRISYNWLKELVPNLKATAEEIAELLTLHSFETVIAQRWHIDPAVTIVRITKLEPHPNADRLQLATVTDGTREVRVVCGAKNIQVGDVVPYAAPGAMLFDENGTAFTVQEATIRSLQSPGMITSLRELGLGQDHSGIFIVPTGTQLGSLLSEHIPDDVILEADVLPNRAHDCLSHIGIAREVAALLGLEVTEPTAPDLPPAQSAVEGITVAIGDERLCPRYLAVVLGGLAAQASPLWLQTRLLAAGSKPINNLVDVTNYVAFEYGNPTHLFDRDKLPAPHITVRRARRGEVLTTLDEVERTLTADDLLIAGGEKPLALAGVMGGVGEAVSSDTRRAVLEVASFNAYSVQESARRHTIHTEAATRFGKGLDPNLVAVTARRAVGLLTELAGATIAGVIDVYPHPFQRRQILFHPTLVTATAGTDITTDQTRDVLSRLRCQVTSNVSPWSVVPPSDRLDLVGEHDLVEEVIRVVGLGHIPAKPPASDRLPLPLMAAPYWREVARDVLVELGFTETYNYSFEPTVWADILGLVTSGISLVNPVSPEQKNLRASLLPGLLANVVTNRDDFHKKFRTQEKALFEVGRVYRPGAGGQVPGVIEEEHIAGILVGTCPDAEKAVQAILDRFQAAATDEIVKFVGELPAKVLAAIKYRVPIAAFVLSLTELVKHAPEEQEVALGLEQLRQQAHTVKRYTPFSRFPSVLRDVSLLVDPSVSVEQVQEIIERTGGDLVVDTDLFDEFEPAGANTKGLAFHIEYQAHDRTLTDKEVNSIHEKLARALEAELGAQIR